jgi:hypothetical protein
LVGDKGCTPGTVLLEGPTTEQQLIDDHGQVEFLGLLPGSYQAYVSCAPGMDLQEQIDVGSEPLTHVWSLAQGLSVTGVVTGSSGVPLAGAHVAVTPIGEPQTRFGAACDSGERGAFVCAGLAPGDYDCLLRENDVERSEPVRVTLSPDAPPPVVALRALLTASLHVRIENPDALQLDALAVLVQSKAFGPVLAERRRDTFVFEKLPLGRYEVMIEPDAPGRSRSVQLERPDTEIEMALSGLESSSLSGRVVDEAGNGVPDAWLQVSGASLYGALRPAAPVMSDADGTFTVPGLLPGQYRIQATSNRGEGELESAQSGGAAVSVPVRTYGSLTGSVTTVNGTVVPSFVVSYGQRESGSLVRVAGHRGTWTVPWLPPGTYQVAVTASDGSTQAQVDVVAGRESTLALQLSPPALEPSGASAGTQTR